MGKRPVVFNVALGCILIKYIHLAGFCDFNTNRYPSL